MAFTTEQLMWHYEQLRTLPMDALAEAKIDPAIKEELRCGYSSKRCENVRTNKKGGGLHRFCEFHRRRANKNQWRVDNKRRMRMNDKPPAPLTDSDKGPCASPPATKPAPRSQPYPQRQPSKLVRRTSTQKKLPDPLALSDESCDEASLSDIDIAMLQAILFDCDETSSTAPASYGFMSMLEDSSKGAMVSSPTAVTDVENVKVEWVV